MPEPINADGWQGFIQGLAILGTVISAVVAGWFGNKKTTNKPVDDDDDQQVREALAKALAESNAAKALLAEARMRDDWKAALEATRMSMAGQLDHVVQRFEDGHKELDRRVRDLEKAPYIYKGPVP